MSPADVLFALQKRPFEPFRIQVSDGPAYDIRHPELVMVGLGALVIGIPASRLSGSSSAISCSLFIRSPGYFALRRITILRSSRTFPGTA